MMAHWKSGRHAWYTLHVRQSSKRDFFAIKYTFLKLQNRVLVLGQYHLCYPSSNICVYLQAKPLHTSVAPESSNTVSDIHDFATHVMIYVRIEIHLTCGRLCSFPHLLFVVILLYDKKKVTLTSVITCFRLLPLSKHNFLGWWGN